MNTITSPRGASAAEPARYSAFVGDVRVATGSFEDIALALAAVQPGQGRVHVFDEATTALVDPPIGPLARRVAPPAPSSAPTAVDAAARIGEDAPTAAAPAVGRPRLGVVAREVTLLPRHWEWLALQRGGASAALRRLVDEARRASAGQDARRLAKERTFRFLNAVAGDRAGFEEATRRLFADDAAAFAAQIQTWPADLRDYALGLAREAFGAEPVAAGAGA